MKKYCDQDYYDNAVKIDGISGNDKVLGTDINGKRVFYDRCPIVNITRVSLIALIDSDSLDQCAVYRVPLTQIDGFGFIHLKALGKSAIGNSGYFEHPTLAPKYFWDAIYNLQNNNLEYLYDDVNHNEVKGNNAIDGFTFGNTNIQNNKVSYSTLNYTGGIFDNNTLDNGAVVTISSGTFSNNKVDQNSEVTISEGSMVRSNFTEDCYVEISAHTNYDNNFSQNCKVWLDGGYCRFSSFRGTNEVKPYNINISNCQFNTVSLDSKGSTGTFSNSSFDRALMTNTKNVSLFNILDCTISDYSRFSINGATRLSMQRSSINAEGRILISEGGTLNLRACKVSNNSYFRVLKGVLNSNYTNVSNYSYIQSDTPNTNQCERCHVETASTIKFNDTVSNCRVYYTTVQAASSVYHQGTSIGCKIYYCSVTSNATIYTKNSVNARIYYSQSTSKSRVYSEGADTDHYIYYVSSNANSKIYSLNNSGRHYLYYSSASGNSTINIQGCVGDVRVYGTTATGTSIVRLRDSVSLTRLYYCSATAYYYMYVTKNVAGTTIALHGYGRRTNFVTNPPNGTFVQNF